MVEVLMIELRKLCESKQQDHSHISDPNKPHFKQEVREMSGAIKTEKGRGYCGVIIIGLMN
jgi:hypothetical protein